jgi:hypothetical protein
MHGSGKGKMADMFGAETMFAKKPPKANGQRVSPERRNWVRRETAMIMSKNLVIRERTKELMTSAHLERTKANAEQREARMSKSLKKTASSPFAVDLAAEDERVAEENRIRTDDENMRSSRLNNRKEKAKNEIVLRALSEFSDLDALRREKRAIQEEEQRLRALLSLEKSSVSNKADRLAAERAQRQRRGAKLHERRQAYQESLSVILDEEQQALKRKFGIKGTGNPLDPSKPSFAIRPLHVYKKPGEA